MAIYTLYIFDRHCQCLFFHNWQNNTSSLSDPSALQQLSEEQRRIAPTDLTAASTPASPQKKSNTISWQEEAKLVYGVVISFRSIARKLGLKQKSLLSSLALHPQKADGPKSADGFVSYKTSAYRLHYFESPSLLKFVLTTDPKVETMRHVLRTIYLNIYVEYIVKNPLVKRDQFFHNELFQKELHRFIRSLPVFES